MSDNVLEEKLLDILKVENEKLLHDFVGRLLTDLRTQSIPQLRELLLKLTGRYRLKLAEALMKDGGKDLIPLFIEAVEAERNTLFAKSLLLLLQHFEHSEALTQLLEIESKIQPQLQAAYQRVTGKLKSRFREFFYMEEFRQGRRNPKRMKHASEMMINEPKPVYTPFINQIVAEAEPEYRDTATRVIGEIGDFESVQALQSLLKRILDQLAKDKDLNIALFHERILKATSLRQYVGHITEIAGRPESDIETVVEEILNGRTINFLKQFREDFDISSDLIWTEISGYLQTVLSGEQPDRSARERLKQSLKNHRGHLIEQLEAGAGALGRIAGRLGIENIRNTLDPIIAESPENGDRLLISCLSGMQTTEAQNYLLNIVHPDNDPALVDRALGGLAQFEIHPIPDNILVAATDPEHGSIRRQALELIGKWGPEPEHLEQLMRDSPLAVRADIVEMIAGFRLEVGLPLIYEMLNANLPASLTEVVIRCLSPFPGEQTAKAVRRYLDHKETFAVRQAALETLVATAGEAMIPTFEEALQIYPEGKQTEMIDSFLHILTKVHTRDLPASLLQSRDFWQDQLDYRESRRIRYAALNILERLDWRQAGDFEAWIKVFTSSLNNLKGIRDIDEKGRLRGLIRLARGGEKDAPLYQEEQEEEPENPTTRSEDEPSKDNDQPENRLIPLIEQLETNNHHEHVKALRRLNLLYRAELDLDEHRHERLISGILKTYDENTGAADVLKVAMTLSLKINDPRLLERIKDLGTVGTAEVREFALKLLEKIDTGREERTEHRIKHIFIMDDAQLITKSLTRVLQKEGFQVDFANHPEQGLKSISENRYDLLILDLHMPQINGIRFLEISREQQTVPPRVIFITSSRGPEDIQRMIAMNVNGLLLKPFPITKLMDKIKEIELIP